MMIYQGSVITNFLSQNLQQYKIPVYQRNYEWSREQCKKLFEDIVLAAKCNQMHFTGSIVYQSLGQNKAIQNNIIIDGQQRLTTIYILIKALVDMAVSDYEKLIPQAALFNTDQFNQYNLDETTKVKLKPAKDNNDKAQEIFERINSTGIPLSLADKIRNYILMTEVDQDRLYEEYWLKIEKLLPKEQLSAFFLDYLNIKIDGFAKEDDAYDIFKQVYKSGAYSNESMLQEVHHYARFYHSFLNGNKEYGNEVDELLRSLQKLKQTTVFLFLFRVFDDYNDGTGILSKNELIRVLRFLLNYSIRRLVCEIGSNSLRGLYKTLYSRVFGVEEHKEHYYDSIVSFFKQLTSKDALPDEETFVAALKQNNLYRKNALCKYLLIAIENQGKEKLETEDLSIEHIMPQNKNLSTAWQKMLGTEQWKEIQEKYFHTLGNLTLTGYNSELGDLPFAEKKKKIEEVDSKVVTLYSDVKLCETWDAEKIEKRAERLSKIITKLFAIEEVQHDISFADPRYKEYTCDIPDDATYKTPNYYVLQGERVNVTNFAEMLRTIIARLYEMNPGIIENMAKENVRLLSWSQNIMFSYDADMISGDYKLADTDIYESTGFSAAHIMSIIHALLEIYDIDVTDFVYSARTYKQTELDG